MLVCYCGSLAFCGPNTNGFYKLRCADGCAEVNTLHSCCTCWCAVSVSATLLSQPSDPCRGHACRSGREAKDPALMRLLLEAPWLPAPAVPSFLAATLPLGPDWATAALSTANNLVLLRPPDRCGALGFRVYNTKTRS